MYTPEKGNFQSWSSKVRPESPDMDYDGLKEIQRTNLAQQEKRYKETNDFYDLQREEMQNFSKALEGTTGKDHEYLNSTIVALRDEYKETLKGLKLKDYNTPAVQDKIFEIKNRLMKAKNMSTTSLEQIKKAYELSKGDHMKEAEITQELTKQLALPPDQRDPDILAKIQTDPLYFNSYDYLTGVFDARKSVTEPLQRKDANFFYSYDATYRPELGYFDKDGNWTFDPKPEVLDDAIADPRFYNAMLGMMHPDDVKSLKGSGNKKLLDKAVREQAKKYMNEVFIREEGGKRVGAYDPAMVQKGRTLNPSKYARPTTYDKKEDDFRNEVAAIKQRLQDGMQAAFDEYRSPDGWKGFTFETDSQGRITKIHGTMVDKSNFLYGKVPGEPPTKIETIEVNPDDDGSVQQALSRIKFVFNKDKDAVQAAPLKKEGQEQATKPKIKGF